MFDSPKLYENGEVRDAGYPDPPVSPNSLFVHDKWNLSDSIQLRRSGKVGGTGRELVLSGRESRVE